MLAVEFAAEPFGCRGDFLMFLRVFLYKSRAEQRPGQEGQRYHSCCPYSDQRLLSWGLDGALGRSRRELQLQKSAGA